MFEDTKLTSETQMCSSRAYTAFLLYSCATIHDEYLSLTSQIYKSPIIYHPFIYQCLCNVLFSRMVLYWVENRSTPSSFIPLLPWFLNSARQTMLLLKVFCNLDWLLKDPVFRQRVYELFWNAISYYTEHPEKKQWKWRSKSILY